MLTAERIFLNVGGRANVPDLPGLDQVTYLTNSTLLQLEILPRHLVVVGGSYVGLEFAQIYRRFGSEVTVVEMACLLYTSSRQSDLFFNLNRREMRKVGVVNGVGAGLGVGYTKSGVALGAGSKAMI